MSNPVIGWAKDNPVAAGAAALGVVVVLMMLTGGGEAEASSGDNGAGVQAYYAAVSNQAQAGAAIQTEQIRANASTNQSLIAASYGLETAKIAADTTKYQIGSNERIAANYFVNDNLRMQSEERIAANQIGASVQIAAHEASVGRAQAKAGQPSKTAQAINAGSNIISSVAKVIPFL